MTKVIRMVCIILMLGAASGCKEKSSPSTLPSPAAPAAQAPSAVAPPTPALPALSDTVKVESAGFGVLTIKVPAGGHTNDAKTTPNNPVATAKVTFDSDLLSQLDVTTLGPVDLAPGFGGDAYLQRELAKWAAGFKGKTIEPDLMPALFESDTVRGYYVTATDANPAPGQAKYLVNGFFRASTGVFMLGGLSNDARGAKAEFLEVAKTAHWEPSQAAPENITAPDKPQPSGK